MTLAQKQGGWLDLVGKIRIYRVSKVQIKLGSMSLWKTKIKSKYMMLQMSIYMGYSCVCYFPLEFALLFV